VDLFLLAWNETVKFNPVKRGAQSKGRRDKTGKIEGKTFSQRWLVIASIVLLVAASIAAGIIFQKSSPQAIGISSETAVAKAETPAFKTPHTLAELLDLSPADLEHCDIARMNLLCAEDLPGAENLNVDECLTSLDQWAQHIKAETDRNHHRFKEDPAFYSNSEAFYKMLMMAVVLYEDYGVRYNPRLISSPETRPAADHFFASSSDILIHGLAGPQRMGTCSSMPILYIALGRRLDYPLQLVKAKGHLFMRWDGTKERFNMDATGKGLNQLDDGYYRQWPFPMSEVEIQEEDYLKSLSAKEELSVFLSIRGECQTENALLGDALASHNLACKYVPTWKGNQVMLAYARARLTRPVIQVQPTMSANPNIPADPNPMPQLIQPRNPFQTP